MTRYSWRRNVELNPDWRDRMEQACKVQGLASISKFIQVAIQEKLDRTSHLQELREIENRQAASIGQQAEALATIQAAILEIQSSIKYLAANRRATDGRQIVPRVSLPAE